MSKANVIASMKIYDEVIAKGESHEQAVFYSLAYYIDNQTGDTYTKIAEYWVELQER